MFKNPDFFDNPNGVWSQLFQIMDPLLYNINYMTIACISASPTVIIGTFQNLYLIEAAIFVYKAHSNWFGFIRVLNVKGLSKDKKTISLKCFVFCLSLTLFQDRI